MNAAVTFTPHPDAHDVAQTLSAPAHHVSPTDALLTAIYQTALHPDRLARLQNQLLVHFREDRSADETPLTRVALNHIRRALRIGATHSAMQRERQQVLDVIAAVAPPIAVVDARWRVLGLNRDAEALFGSAFLFSVHDGTLTCREAGVLPALMARADSHAHASARVGSSDSPGDTLVYLYRNSATAPATYSLLLVNHHRCIRQSIATLADRTGLTARESEVIELCLQGLDAQAMATRAGVTPHTLRQHIKNIHAKTGVHSQNALFSLVLRNIVLTEASRTHDTRLLPHITGLAHTRTLHLPDGRQVSYAEYGASDGVPVVYFHSLNSSRLELLLHADLLRQAGVRLISMDRPGYGHSTFSECSDYRDYTDDVAALLDLLQLGQVHLLSSSAGTAHALHAAHALPDRVLSVHCTAIVPPIGHILASPSASTLNSMKNLFFRVVPSLLRPAMELLMLGQTVESLLTMVTSSGKHNAFSLTDADIRFITDPERLPYFTAAMMESLRQGPRAWAMESVLVNQAWSIDLQKIRAPIHLWHGTLDGLVPTDMVSSLAEALPNATLRILEGDSHLLVFRNIERLAHEMRGA